ncbi:MAG: M23 family metallopeptidase [Pseudomonadota bacterium]|nr:M23 family metallopeptidase [Pseudomonadota bacterium]
MGLAADMDGTIAPRRATTGGARRAAIVALACGGVALLVGAASDPVHAGRAASMNGAEAEQLRSIGIAPLQQHGEPGTQVAGSSAVEPLVAAPQRPQSMIDGLEKLAEVPLPPPEPVRVRGRVGDGLFDALAMAGIAPSTAGEFVRTLAGRLDLTRDIAADDHFDLVVLSRAGSGGPRDGALLYAAIDRAGASDVRLMKWQAGGSARWLDTAAAERRAGAMTWPVPGRVSSAFGLRYHPILHYARMHKGVDFAAPRGQPIVASADGTVSRAGWAGGYGQQIRIVHGAGMTSSYSHLGRMAVAAGQSVRAGQVIGFVGSTGLSTGPHLHYEVLRGGAHINPLSATLVAPSPLAARDLERFWARFGQIMALRPEMPATS